MSKRIVSAKSPSKVSRGATPPLARGKLPVPAVNFIKGAAIHSPLKPKATTLRLKPELQQGLELLHEVLKQPINKMVNEAVKGFIDKRTAEVESDLKGVLAQIKAYKRVDPKFAAAIAQFVDAEARLGGEDPVEGVVVDAEPGGAAAARTKFGPAQAMVRELLSS